MEDEEDLILYLFLTFLLSCICPSSGCFLSAAEPQSLV